MTARKLWLIPLAFSFAAQAALDPPGVSRELDACTDFYRYANARWLDAVRIPDDRSRWSTFDIVGERNSAILEGAFEDARKSGRFAAGTAQRKVVDYYASGLDREAIERA